MKDFIRKLFIVEVVILEKNSPFLIKCLGKREKNYSPADLTIHEIYKTNHYKWKNLSNTA